MSSRSAADIGLLPQAHEDVLYALAMYGPLPLDHVRDYANVKGRELAGALTALRLCGSKQDEFDLLAAYDRLKANSGV